MINKNFFWIFLVASKPEDGGGHMMRSIALARTMLDYNDIHFVLDQKGEYWLSRLEDKGFTVEFFNERDDFKLTLRDDNDCLGIFVDDYNVTNKNLLKWKQRYGKLAVIADFEDTPEFVDFVISPSLAKSALDYKHQINMNGPTFAMLSPEYSNNININECDEINTILLSFGFFDSKNCTESTLNILNKIGFHGVVKIAIGSQAIHLSNIKKKLSNYIFKTEVFENTDGLYELNLNVDFVIGAGGVSLLERMALGKSSVTVVTAYNQLKQSQWAENIGATLLVDASKENFQESLKSAIIHVLSSKDIRKNMSINGMAAIDGRGALRVSEILIKNK